MSRRLAILGVIVAFGMAAAGAAQTPARDARPAPLEPSGTSTVSGTVVTAAGVARPVRLAYVVIVGAATGVLRVTSSDDRGHFSFSNLPADRYVVGASKPPFLGSVAGAKRPARPGIPVAVKDGETIADVTIRMPLGAAVSGVITDEQGQPAAGVIVGLQRRTMQGGERVWSNVGGSNTATDERGRYRFHTLPPGEYAVVAMRGGAPGAGRTLTDAEVDAALKGNRVAPASATDPASVPAPVYFPGTTRQSDAAPIALAAGEERSSVDFRLETVRTASIEGTVTTGDGPPAPNVVVMFSSASPASSQRGGGARVMPDGSFKIPNLAPGSYMLTAREMSPPSRWAIATVEIRGSDQLGLQLTLRPLLAMSGRIAFEGPTPSPAIAGRRVPFRSLMLASNGGVTPPVSPTGATGAFSVTDLLPGQYALGGPLFFGASSDSVTWALQSVVADGKDITDLPLVISTDSVPKDVVVTYGDRWQDLSGRLRQASNTAATDYTLVVFPADKKYWLPGSRRILTVRPDTDGQFRFGGPGPVSLPAGDYLLAAVTDIDRDEQFDPAFLDALVPAAVPVALRPGEKKAQDVVIK